MATAPIPAPQSNPILDEIDRAHATLSPAAQQAIEQAHGIIGLRKTDTGGAVEKAAAPVDGIKPAGIGPLALGAGVADPINVSASGDQATIKPNATNADFAAPGLGPPVEAPATLAPGEGITPATDFSRAPRLSAPGAASDIAAMKPMAAPASRAPIGAPPMSPEATAHRAELNRITTGEQAKSGIGQIGSAWGRVPLQILDAIGSGLFPRIAQYIPGTEAHHQLEVGRSTSAVNADEAEREKEAKIGTEAAQARDLNAQAAERENPQAKANKEWEEIRGGAVDPDHPEGGTQVAFYNKNDGTIKYGKAQVAAKEAKEPKSDIHAMYADAVADAQKRGVKPADDPKVQETLAAITALNREPAATKPDVHVIYADAIKDAIGRGTDPNEDPKVQQIAKAIHATQNTPNDTEIIHKQIGGKPHNVMVKKGTGEVVADLGELGEKESSENAGTWSIQEDADGKPILFNSKTSETKPVTGVQKSGTAAKSAPTRDAYKYSVDYLNGGKFTGPGDIALMDKFFALAKSPRMSQSQLTMLENSRSLMEGAVAKAKHYLTPDAPWFDETQRKNIADTMRQIAEANGLKIEGATAPHGGPASSKSIDDLVKKHGGR